MPVSRPALNCEAFELLRCMESRSSTGAPVFPPEGAVWAPPSPARHSLGRHPPRAARWRAERLTDQDRRSCYGKEYPRQTSPHSSGGA